MEEKVKLKINGGLRSTYLKLLRSDTTWWKLAWEASMEAGSLSFNEFLQLWFSILEMQRKMKEKKWEEVSSTREKPWKEELHHQETALDKKLREEDSMEEKNERERGGRHEIEGEKEGEKLNFEVCLTSFSFIKVVTSVIGVSIYSLGH